jgi:hypothetical protein
MCRLLAFLWNEGECIMNPSDLDEGRANLKCDSAYGFGYKRFPHKVARFRQVDKEKPNVHHDALELPDGEIVMVTTLAGGQHATVLQLPASPREIRPETGEAVVEVITGDRE